jgi:hypothetical protein
MMKVRNKTRIDGRLYQHTLELKESGPNSKNPGTQFITGNVEIATDNAITNIVTVHYTYVTATTSTGKSNATFNVLKDIIDGKLGSVMANGADNAAIITIDSAIGLNEFYSDRSGKEELVSAKRNEGGFAVVKSAADEDETKRNTFDVDMIITGAFIKEADPEKDLPEKMILRGAIFDFRNSLLPIELSVLNPRAISYFESLEITQRNPVFTRLQGRQVSEVVTREVIEESAFGDPVVKKFASTRKDWVVTWAASEPYAWNDESTITTAELTKAMSDRETYLATLKQRQDEYKASKNQPAATPANAGFQF